MISYRKGKEKMRKTSRKEEKSCRKEKKPPERSGSVKKSGKILQVSSNLNKPEPNIFFNESLVNIHHRIPLFLP
jgi:hypothetical protein